MKHVWTRQGQSEFQIQEKSPCSQKACGFSPLFFPPVPFLLSQSGCICFAWPRLGTSLPSSYWLNFCVTILNSSEKESLWFIQSTCSFPESGGYDCHSVQLVLGRSRGLMASEVAMGGATSNQELDRDLDTGLSQKRISMSLKKNCRKYPRCQGRHGEL